MKFDEMIEAQAHSPRRMDPCDIAFHYHERTKHHYFRYAPALGYMCCQYLWGFPFLRRTV